MPCEVVSRSFCREYSIAPRMSVADVVGRHVGKRTERLQRRCLIHCLVYRHLVQHPRYILADVYHHRSVVLNEAVLLYTAVTHKQ